VFGGDELDESEALRVSDRQRPQPYRVDQLKNGGIGADPEGK
jgi:hypothetical protein